MNRISKPALAGIAALSALGVATIATNTKPLTRPLPAPAPEPEVPALVEPAAWSTVTSIGKGYVALRSVPALTEIRGEPALVYVTSDGAITLAHAGKTYTVASIGAKSAKAAGATLAVSATGEALVAWRVGTSVYASTSLDLSTWTTPVVIGTAGEGGSFHSACWGTSGPYVAWVTAGKESATGAMDAPGTMSVARLSGSKWAATTLSPTVAVVSCDGDVLTYRVPKTAGQKFDHVWVSHADGTHAVDVGEGYDPAAAADGTTIVVAYHIAGAAYFAVSRDSGPWEHTKVDINGQFVDPFVVESDSDEVDGVGAVWISFPDAEAAADPRDSSRHRVGSWWGSEGGHLNGGVEGTTGGQGAIVAGRPAAVYSLAGDPGDIYIVW